MYALLIGGLDLHAKGLPKWMAVKDVDHLSAKEKSRILHHADENVEAAKKDCLKNKALGARCIFGDTKK